jgi:hypothetical protein
MYRNGGQVHSIVGVPPEPELRSQIEKHLGDAGEASRPVAGKKPNRMFNDALGKLNGKESAIELPQDKRAEEVPKGEPRKTAKEPNNEGKTNPSKETEKPQEPAKSKEPAIQPMKKDWVPPGMQRKGE